ncbi:MAG: hypothetical protein R3D31_13975 [Hyphomicrobiaceae bacterium]
MNMIQSVLLVLLGFSAASLIGLLIAPALRARTVRLTRARLQSTLPVSEAEIRADKDRIRADYAIRVHRLHMSLEQAKLGAARQLIELNRRDARISDLESNLSMMQGELEEHQNARRVLEQTVTDRVPKIEQRLIETKALMEARDREIAALSETARKQKEALAEIGAINAQQRAEIARLKQAILARQARNRDGLRDAVFEGEAALRAEIEGLQARAVEQAGMIARLESEREHAQRSASIELGLEKALAVRPDETARLNSEIDRLKGLLAEAETKLADAKSGQGQLAARESEIKALQQRYDEQAAEVLSLKASLKAFEEQDAETSRLSIRESRIALKARLNALQVKTDQQDGALHRLRTELAGANERLARQAAHFMDEMRRLGAGTLPASAQPRPIEPRTGRSRLAERVGEPRSVSPRLMAPALREINGEGGAPAQTAQPAEPATMVPSGGAAATATRRYPAVVAAVEAAAVEPSGEEASATPPAAEVPTGRKRLLDRLSSIGKS